MLFPIIMFIIIILLVLFWVLGWVRGTSKKKSNPIVSAQSKTSSTSVVTGSAILPDVKAAVAEVREIGYFERSNDLREVDFGSGPRVYTIAEWRAERDAIRRAEENNEPEPEISEYTTKGIVIEEDRFDQSANLGDNCSPWNDLERFPNKTKELTAEDFKRKIDFEPLKDKDINPNILDGVCNALRDENL